MALILVLTGISFAKYSGGTGEPNDPYLIATPNDLNAIGTDSNDWDKHFKMIADVNMAGFTGIQFNLIGYWETWYTSNNKPFTGIFDGNNYTISNFTYSVASRNGVGVFTCLGSGAEIKNLRLENADVNSPGGYVTGGLVGHSEGTISNCSISGSITGLRYVGGLAGHNDEGSVFNCSVQGTVIGSSFAIGGLVGDSSGFISNCHTAGLVKGGGGGLVGESHGLVTHCYSTATVQGESCVAGLVGISHFGMISNCFATGDVTGDFATGGLVGDNSSDEDIIINCYATGDVTGGLESTGGLVGRNYSQIYNSYATGKVTGDFWVGGLVGSEYSPIYGDCFWNREVNPDVNAVGNNATDPNGIFAETTANMQIQSTYTSVGWDFVGERTNGPSDLWAMPEGNGYPILWYQMSPLPPLPTFAGGAGSAAEPYLIADANHFNRISHNPRLMQSHFHLVDDVNLADVNTLIIGHIAYPFMGTFDGASHQISHFTCESTGENHVGLFRYIAEGGHIMNLGLVEVDVNSTGNGRFIGGLAGYSSGTIWNCYVEGQVSGAYECVGGLLGENYGTVTDCYTSSSVRGHAQTGGVIGYNNGTIATSLSIGQVVADYYHTGGLIGQNGGNVLDCYAQTTVLGDKRVGGLVGSNDDTVVNCYSTGPVSGVDYLGGLVGSNGGWVFNSYWDANTSGTSNSSGGIAKATSEMMDTNTFLGWNCGNAWIIDPNNDYPRLVWENQPGQPIINPPYAGGTGEENTPFLISTAEELFTLRSCYCDWDKNFKLVDDIDLQGTSDSKNIIGFNQQYPFSGTFEGGGYRVSNYSYTSDAGKHIGLFGYLDGPNAVIRSLRLVDPNIAVGVGDYAGCLAGYAFSGCIMGCQVENASVSGDKYIGGLCGGNGTAKISYCSVSGFVNGGQYTGGLMGFNSSGIVSNCSVLADVTGSTYNTGGLSGYNGTNTQVLGCYVEGNITGSAYYTGGLVAKNEGIISNCYTRGSVNGKYDTGGLIGKNQGGTISDCFAACAVSSSSRIGALTGNHSAGSYSACFWDRDLNPSRTGIGNMIDPAEVIGETTSNMQLESTFTNVGWDFVGESVNGTNDVWTINEGLDYPQLVWPLVNFIGWYEVGLSDFAFFANRWRDDNCGGTNNCDGSDLDFSGAIDEIDLSIFCEHWLNDR